MDKAFKRMAIFYSFAFFNFLGWGYGGVRVLITVIIAIYTTHNIIS